MERTDLRLIPAPRAEGVPRSRRIAAALTGSLVLFAGLLATGLGADRARRPFRGGEMAQRALDSAFREGREAPEIRETIRALRTEVGRRPLDARTRVLYASVLLEFASDESEAAAAAFHARQASEVAPVTVPVVRQAALVLARSGDRERAIALTKAMFGYDPEAAAALLATLEPFVQDEGVARALPDDPAAWLAWIGKLRGFDRAEEASAMQEEASRRWPQDSAVLERSAWDAVNLADWKRVEVLLPPERPVPRAPAAPRLWAYRARMLAATGRPDRAKADVREAERLAQGDAWVLLQAGIALEAAGDPAGGRRLWDRALHSLPAVEGWLWLRVELLTRIARQEDREGRPVDALRAWRDVLRLAPEHDEAQRRVDDLTGFNR